MENIQHRGIVDTGTLLKSSGYYFWMQINEILTFSAPVLLFMYSVE
jgi:hypothetical protein